ncbi:MAG: TonB-dependent receptor [Myxococcota bacterium]
MSLGGLWLATYAVTASAEEPVQITVTAKRDSGPPPGTTEVRVDDVARPADGLEDVLATVPGVRVRRLGGLGAFAGVSLRGTAFRQSLVRLDGIPLNPDGVEAVDLSRWPLAGLASILVTPGRPPATVGAAPIGGVVDLITRSGARFVQGEVARGSFDSTRGSLAGSLPWGGSVPGDLLVAGDVLDTAGDFSFPDDGGTRYDVGDDETRLRENNDRRQGAGLLRVRIGDDLKRATLLASVAGREEGLPGPIGLPLPGARLTTWRGLAGVDGEGVVGASRIGGGLWFLGRTERLSDPDQSLPRVPGVQRFRTGTVGARLWGQGALFTATALRGSVDVRREGFDRRDGDEASPALTASRYGLGAAVDLPIHLGDTLQIIPGLDVRGLMSVDPEPESTGAVLPGTVLRFQPSPAIAVWASGGAGFRPPDLTELYGDRGALIGNPNLLPERAWKTELGVRVSRAGDLALATELAAYAVVARDAIGWLQNTQRTLVAVNFGRTRTVGGDLGAALSYDERIGIRASGSLTHAIQTTDDPTRAGRPVPFVAPARLWGRIWGRPGLGLEAGLDIDHTSAVPVDPQGIVAQPQRTLLGASLSWTEPSGWFTLSVDLDNLLNVRTGPVDRDPLGAEDTSIPAPITDFVGYPLPGRTGWLSLRFHPPLETP